MNGPEEMVGATLLIANLALLWSAGVRIATLALPLGPERAIAALTVGAAVVVISALALGVFGLGSHPLALTAVSASLALVIRRRLPASPMPPRVELADWWARRGLREGCSPERDSASAWRGPDGSWPSPAWISTAPSTTSPK